MGLTQEVIASLFAINVRNFKKRVKKHFGQSFDTVFKRRGAQGALVVRTGIYQLAKKGNLGALIYLDKKFENQFNPQPQQAAIDVSPNAQPREEPLSPIEVAEIIKSHGYFESDSEQENRRVRIVSPQSGGLPYAASQPGALSTGSANNRDAGKELEHGADEEAEPEDRSPCSIPI